MDVKKARGYKMSDSRLAYFIMLTQTNERGEFIPLIAKEGQPGYYLTDWTWGRNQDIAETLCRERNTKMGLSKKDVDQIITSTWTW